MKLIFNVFLCSIIFMYFSIVHAQALTVNSDEQDLQKEKNNFISLEAKDVLNKEDIEGNPQTQKIEDQEIRATQKNLLNSFWKTEFKAKTFTDRSTTDTVLSTEMYGKLNWEFFSGFSFHTQGLIIGRSGFTQSIYDRTDRKNGIYLLEGYFRFKPSSSTFLRVGNSKQDFLEAPLLITDKTFPSFLQTIDIDLFNGSKLLFIFQQAIPDNGSEALRRESQIIRGAPLFLTASSFIDIEPFSRWDISFKEKFTLFSFLNLPPALAEAGRTRGNSVNLMKTDARFKYKFFGIHNNLNIQIPISEYSILEVGGDFLYNLMAPDTFNQGERLYSSVYFNHKNFIEIKLTGEYFANQSDSSIAYYNSEIYGHNNRIGALLRFQSYFYKSGITASLTYIYSQAINPERSAIGVSNAVVFSLGTRYISI